jgi:hypothetical protein
MKQYPQRGNCVSVARPRRNNRSVKTRRAFRVRGRDGTPNTTIQTAHTPEYALRRSYCPLLIAANNLYDWY